MGAPRVCASTLLGAATGHRTAHLRQCMIIHICGILMRYEEPAPCCWLQFPAQAARYYHETLLLINMECYMACRLRLR